MTVDKYAWTVTFEETADIQSIWGYPTEMYL